MSAKSIKWDAAADAKLFSLIIQLYNVKLGGENLRNLNVAMGLAPNSQSLTHRIGYLKKQACLPSASVGAGEAKSAAPRAGARKATKILRKGCKDSVVEEGDEFNDSPKSGPVSKPEHTPFYNGGTQSLKRKSSDDDDDDDDGDDDDDEYDNDNYEKPSRFTRSLMSSKKKKVEPVENEQADNEDADYLDDMHNKTVWDDLTYAI